MPAVKNKLSRDTEAQAEVKRMLREMLEDPSYNTESSYCADTDKYPDGKIPFVDKHFNYLLTHSSINPTHYLANLRLMTRRG